MTGLYGFCFVYVKLGYSVQVKKGTIHETVFLCQFDSPDFETTSNS